VVLAGCGFLFYVYIVQMYGHFPVQHLIKADALALRNVVDGSDVKPLTNDEGGRVYTQNLFNAYETDQVTRYIKFHVPGSGSVCKGQRFLVYRCKNVCGGWGDRLKGITTMFLLAQLTNRTFLIDMPKPCEFSTLLSPNKYEWNKCLVEAKSVNSNSSKHISLMSPINLKKMDDIIYGNLSKNRVISIQTNVQEVHKIRKHNTSRERIPWMYNLTDAEVLGSIIGTLFKPSLNLSDALVNFKTEDVRGRRLVCSHIRMGKNPTIPSDNNRRRDAPNATEILNFLKQYDDDGNNAVFVATDSEEVRNQSRKLLSNFVSSDGKIIHVDRHNNVDKNDLCDGFFTVLLDYLILSKCDVLLLTRSNFGAMASYIRGSSNGLYLQNRTKGQSNIFRVSLSEVQETYKFV